MEPETLDAPGATARSTARTKLIAVIAVIAIAGYAMTRTTNAPAFAPTGDPVALPAAGKLTELSADEFEGVLVGLRGRPVIVNIWASWCAPCRTETPLLERTWRAHGDDVTIIGVASKDSPSGALGFMHEFEVGYPNAFDGSGQIRARMGLRGFPTTYVFGADGKLRTTILGGLTEQRLAAIIEDLRT